MSSANVFTDQLKLEERKKDLEEKELKEKLELSEKIEKNQREKVRMKKEMKSKKKRKRESYLATVGEVRRFSQKSIFVHSTMEDF